jgi:hypothetical protein
MKYLIDSRISLKFRRLQAGLKYPLNRGKNSLTTESTGHIVVDPNKLHCDSITLIVRTLAQSGAHSTVNSRSQFCFAR